MIGRLGLRYRPTDRTDLEAHAAQLALLATDLADVPEGYLGQAIEKWVRAEKWMPKASELVALAQGFADAERNRAEGPATIYGTDAFAVKANANCSRPGLRWSYENGNLVLSAA